ncbi:MAG: TonB-dependent receptor [Sphingomonadaceae bacterium]|nr:TonB-dependent receptor [Sphingomonadaceae bacterium]
MASCALAAAFAFEAPVFAQNAPSAASSDATGSSNSQSTLQPSNGGDIVVTARRRAESLEHVPVAVTAFSQVALERKAISDPFSLNKAVPGLQVDADSGSGALPSFSIRGRGQFFGAASGSVETYFADVPLSAPYQIPTLPPQFFDLQSLQVLKGPQGTLFGRNTTGGAVLFVPAAPTDQLGGYARLQGGTHEDVQFEAAVNLPFSEKVMLRLAAFEWHRKGYTHTTGGFVDRFGNLLPEQYFDNQDVTEVRGTLLLKPTDTFTNSTIFTYHTDKNRGTTQVNKVNPASPYGPLINAFYTKTNGVPDYLTDGPRVTEENVDLRRPPSSTFAVINTSTLALADALTVKNIFGYIHSTGWGNNPGDADGSPAPAVDLPKPPRFLHNFQTTDELQLQGNLLDNRLTYIIGGMIDLTRQPGGLDSINIATNSGLPGAPGFDEQFRQSTFTTKSLFGSATYKLTDTLSVTGGIRNTWDNIKERSCENDSLVDQSSAATCAATVGFTVGQKKFSGLSYNGSIEWRPNAYTMIYGGYRRGYKRGGFNAKGTGLALFAPETVDDFYVGLKQDLGRLGLPGHFNIEGFWDNYHNAQRSFLSFDPSVGALATVIANAPKARYRGFDMDFDVEPTKWLELFGNYTFVDAKYLKYPDNTCSINSTNTPVPGLVPGTNYCFEGGAFAGAPGVVLIGGGAGFVPNAVIQAINPGDQATNPMGLVSRHKFSLGARFHTEMSDGSEIALSPSVNYQSKFYINDQAVRQPNAGAALFGPVNSAAVGATVAPGYTTVDLRVEWNKIRGSKFDIAANVTNLTNKTFITGGAGIYQLGFNAVAYGAPRMFTAEVKYHF